MGNKTLPIVTQGRRGAWNSSESRYAYGRNSNEFRRRRAWVAVVTTLVIVLAASASTALAQQFPALPAPDQAIPVVGEGSSTLPPASNFTPPRYSQRPVGGQVLPSRPVSLPRETTLQAAPPALPQGPGPNVLPNPDGAGGLPPSSPVPVVPGGAPVMPGHGMVQHGPPQPYGKYIKSVIDSQAKLDLVEGQTRLVVFKQTPKRVQIADDKVASYTVISPTELSLMGGKVGVTVLTIWFTDPAAPGKQEVLSYKVRVFPDPDDQGRRQMIYDTLAKQINHLFPNSQVRLKLIGGKVAVSGFAHDINEAAKILQVVRVNVAGNNDTQKKTAKIPFDRQTGKPIPPQAAPGGILPIGAKNYETMGGPEIINLLKVTGEQQVMLRVMVAEVNRSAARSIGLNFTLLNRNGAAYFANNTGLLATGGQSGNVGAFGFFFGGNNAFGISPFAGFPAGLGGFNNLPTALDNGQIRLAVNALRNLNYARSLAEPTLVTMNGQTANFRAGGEFPVPVVTGFTNSGLQGVNFVPFGVQLNFTPFITDRDRIRLVIAAEVSNRDLAAGVTNIGGAAVPSLSSRNFQTVVELREGQTLAVAGLIQNNLGGDASRLPFLGDLPIVGRLFGADRITAGEQELVILITPELVHPMEKNEVPPLPGSDLFEPTDLEFYLHGRLESHYPIDYRSPVRTDYSRIHDYRTMENLYLFGPHGHVYDTPHVGVPGSH